MKIRALTLEGKSWYEIGAPLLMLLIAVVAAARSEFWPVIVLSGAIFEHFDLAHQWFGATRLLVWQSVLVLALVGGRLGFRAVSSRPLVVRCVAALAPSLLLLLLLEAHATVRGLTRSRGILDAASITVVVVERGARTGEPSFRCSAGSVGMFPSAFREDWPISFCETWAQSGASPDELGELVRHLRGAGFFEAPEVLDPTPRLDAEAKYLALLSDKSLVRTAVRTGDAGAERVLQMIDEAKKVLGAVRSN